MTNTPTPQQDELDAKLDEIMQPLFWHTNSRNEIGEFNEAKAALRTLLIEATIKELRTLIKIGRVVSSGADETTIKNRLYALEQALKDNPTHHKLVEEKK